MTDLCSIKLADVNQQHLVISRNRPWGRNCQELVELQDGKISAHSQCTKMKTLSCQVLIGITRSQENGKTKVNLTIYNESRERMEKMIEMGFTEGFKASMNNLENLLETLLRQS